jgi:hypothetical protein
MIVHTVKTKYNPERRINNKNCHKNIKNKNIFKNVVCRRKIKKT